MLNCGLNSGSANRWQVMGQAGNWGTGRGGGKEQQQCEKGNHNLSSLRWREDNSCWVRFYEQKGLGHGFASLHPISTQLSLLLQTWMYLRHPCSLDIEQDAPLQGLDSLPHNRAPQLPTMPGFASKAQCLVFKNKVTGLVMANSLDYPAASQSREPRGAWALQSTHSPFLPLSGLLQGPAQHWLCAGAVETICHLQQHLIRGKDDIEGPTASSSSLQWITFGQSQREPELAHPSSPLLSCLSPFGMWLKGRSWARQWEKDTLRTCGIHLCLAPTAA